MRPAQWIAIAAGLSPLIPLVAGMVLALRGRSRAAIFCFVVGAGLFVALTLVTTIARIWQGGSW